MNFFQTLFLILVQFLILEKHNGTILLIYQETNPCSFFLALADSWTSGEGPLAPVSPKTGQ